MRKKHRSGIHLNLTDDQVRLCKTAAGAVLAVLGAVGTVAVSVVAPNLLQVLGKFYRYHGKKTAYKSAELKRAMAQTVYYLKASGHVRVLEGGRGSVFELTEKGLKKFGVMSQGMVAVPRPKHWDGRWWLTAADIPTANHRKGADLLRKKLKHLGFFPLQRTMWLYPYNPCQAVEQLAQMCGVGHYITVMEVSRLDEEDERKVSKFFRDKDVLRV